MEEATNACLLWAKNGDPVRVDVNSDMRLKIDQVNSLDWGNPIPQQEVEIEIRTSRNCTNEVATKQFLGKDFPISSIKEQPINLNTYNLQKWTVRKYFQY